MNGFLSWRALGLAAAAIAVAPSHASAAIDLSNYVRVGRFDLPEPTRTQAPAGNLLGQEASGVTYDRDTGTLFVVGDGGTSVTQVSKTGQLVNTMTLQANEFNDTEGITYTGGGKFVFTEERLRQLVQFTYAGGGTLTRAATQTVKLGTTVGNIGLEGLSYDPQTGGYIVVKETQPLGIFQTGIDFAAGTATNGSPTTENSVNLFDPALAGVSDFSDVYALSNLPAAVSGADAGHLLIISQEAGRIVEVDRAGLVSGSLTIASDAGNPLSVPDQGHEGITMDDDGRIYTVSEAGGGDNDHPQLWVYAPSTGANQPPSAVSLTNPVPSLPETTSTAQRVKVAGVAIVDDGLGTNNLSVTGPDAASFEVDSSGLYLKAGTVLNHTTKPSYTVSVAVDDPSAGGSPDATSAPYTLTITAPPPLAQVAVTEVSPWSSGNSPYAADWFEVTNTGATPVDLTDWKIDDSSNQLSSAVRMTGVPSIAPGESAIFTEGDHAAAFKTAWFGASVPAGFQIGNYSGSGVGLSTDGDAVNLFDSFGRRVTGVTFGASTSGFTFDNAAGAGTVAQLSAICVNGAFKSAANEVGSPGTHATANVSGTVPATLSLTLGPAASFGGFTPGLDHEYTAQTTATVISTAGDATLSVSDPGHLTNGAFSLPEALRVEIAPSSWTGPVSNATSTITFRQHIGTNDALRTGTYSRTLTFTLSTTSP
jgi:uncharacterized protein YjiK